MAPPPSSFASGLTLSAVGLWCKAFLGLTTRGYDVRGAQHLLKALEMGKNEGEREAAAALAAAEAGEGTGKGKDASVPGEVGSLPRRGIITIANHNSVVDDPMMWTLFPLSSYMPMASSKHTCHNLRWTLGASDIMFTNPAMSKFFTWGQVIETVRGGGIYQPAVDTAIRRLEQGGWVHIFPEGRVNQEKPNPEGGLHRFKWGVGRIIMDAPTMPEIIPIWISGFDQIMSERRTWPGLPRSGASVSITVGAPITSRVQPLLESYRAAHEAGTEDSPHDTRIRIVEELQAAVRELGEGVEEREGRFERGEWSQSRRGVPTAATAKAKVAKTSE